MPVAGKDDEYMITNKFQVIFLVVSMIFMSLTALAYEGYPRSGAVIFYGGSFLLSLILFLKA